MSEVSLVGITKPDIKGIETAEELIAYAARVSNPESQFNKNSSGLIKYLIKHKHWSPFEIVSLTLEIKTTRDIGRQLLRHRSFSFQEFSQRYAIVTDFRLREARIQDLENRQNSIVTTDRELRFKWFEKQAEVINIVQDNYKWAIDNGIAKEQARSILPEGNTDSTLYMAGTLRSWIHYCQLRMGHGTQLEHKVVAEQCWAVIGQHFPSIVEALKDGED